MSDKLNNNTNKLEKITNNKYGFIEVCAGGGGLSSGLIKSGFIPNLYKQNEIIDVVE